MSGDAAVPHPSEARDQRRTRDGDPDGPDRNGDPARPSEADDAREQEKLDEALDESFPASDPPAVRPGRPDTPPPGPDTPPESDKAAR